MTAEHAFRYRVRRCGAPTGRQSFGVFQSDAGTHVLTVELHNQNDGRLFRGPIEPR